MDPSTKSQVRGFAPTIQNISKLMSLLTITIILSFLVLLSFFHGDVKAFVLILGVFILYVLMTVPYGIQETLSNMFKYENITGTSQCKSVDLALFDWPEKPFPSLSTAIMGMINTSLLYPMVNLEWQNENLGLIIGLSVITAVMFVVRYQNQCDGGDMISLGLGLAIGIFFGILYFAFVNSVFPQGVYHGYFSNKSVCAVKAQTFVCKKRKV